MQKSKKTGHKVFHVQARQIDKLAKYTNRKKNKAKQMEAKI